MANNENLSNSIWPNGIKTDSEGYAIFYPLGSNKISVPSTTEEWPAGDKLISPFVYQDDKLVGFCDTKAMTVSGQTSITLNYEHIEADFSSIEEGMLTITAPNATITKYIWANSSSSDTGNSGDTVTFKYKGCTTVDELKAVDPDYVTNDIVGGTWSERLDDLVDGTEMFADFSALKSLTSFTADLPSLTNGYWMFSGCYNLTSFYSNLSSLTDGRYMFQRCTKLTSFSSDLSSLTNGANMFFACTKLTSFSSDLSSLTDGYGMFSDCSQLTSFSADLFSLTCGGEMFYNCTNLTTFNSNLSSLTDGEEMFSGCKLNTTSVQNIAKTINNINGEAGDITIDIGNSTPNEQEETAFNTIASKGWTVYVNGSQYTPTSPAAIVTLDETGKKITTPIPFYAKPVQSDEKHAHYVDENGNYYNILGAQFIYGDSLETYGMFTCEEDAAANMRLTKIEK